MSDLQEYKAKIAAASNLPNSADRTKAYKDLFLQAVSTKKATLTKHLLDHGKLSILMKPI